MKNRTQQRPMARRLSLAALSLLSASSVLLLPTSGVAETTHTSADIDFAVFVPCAADGVGEIVLLSSTLHLVTRDGVVVHGNQSGGSGVGLTTGDTYLATGSASNLNPAGDGDYIYHLGWVGVGANGAKFSITAKGPIAAPPTEIVQVHCS